MRATLGVCAIVLTLAALVGAGHLWAEDKARKPPTHRTRIALLNLASILKKYDKYRDFQEEIKEVIEPFQRKDASLRMQGEKLRVELEKMARELSTGEQKGEEAAQGKEALQMKVIRLQRAMEDNQTEAKAMMAKKTEEGMKTMFQDLSEAAKRYATQNGLDVVLFYSDATTAVDYYSTPNIVRKLNSGALLPLTSRPGIDISKEVLDLLNLGPRPTP
jgi:Skp family chaperone for outer membrane proteins